ncbi:Unknown protein [Striga hermonthica]|uniref:Uncharacterized protein n=1 Tax=Striga hermonthica TaxID=68872 RepID=A0A9N7RPG2_STRHE|nr:Unknown protein [Striga hermonthica]
MGNCQAIDNASILIQYPNAAKIERLYAPIAAADVMKANPGHHVALLLTTTTLYSSSSSSAARESRSSPLRVTRIKLLRPTDNLVIGHAYRLVTAQEVMKGLWAKKQKIQQQQQRSEKLCNMMREKDSSDFQTQVGKKTDVNKTSQVKHERQRSRNNRSWQPALKSISEAAI